jgi:hypothetical protein
MRRALVTFLIAATTFGCASTGILPREPLYTPTDTSCTPLLAYAHKLSEAYRARASANRFAIYVAGVAAIGTAAVVGGLASSGSHDTGTITVVTLSGASIAAAAALFDNQGLARFYTAAANRITRAAAQPASCEALAAEIAATRNDLETARTGVANKPEPVL